MTDIKISSPAISNFYKAVASQIQPYIPSQFSPLELAAASTSIAQRLAGEKDPDHSHFREAVQLYMQSLPSDPDLANGIVKHDAGVVLGIPQLKGEHDRLTAARDELARVEAEIAAAEAIQGNRLRRIQQLDKDIFCAENGLQKWNLDFDAIEARAESTIADLWSDGSPGAVYAQHHIDAAFEDIARVRILRKLEPDAVAKLKATIVSAQSELAELRAEVVGNTPPETSEPAPMVRGRVKLPETATAD